VTEEEFEARDVEALVAALALLVPSRGSIHALRGATQIAFVKRRAL